MPVYKFPLTNGKTLRLEGEGQPSDADVERAAQDAGVELQPAPLSAQEQATAGMRGLGDAARAVAPVFAAGAGVLGGAALGLGPAVGRLLSHPATGSALAAYSGYRRSGIPGAIEGAVTGAIPGSLGRLATMARRAAAPAAAIERPAGEALTSLGRNLVLSPADAARKAQLMSLAAQEATQAGTVAAGTTARGPVSLVEQLFGMR